MYNTAFPDTTLKSLWRYRHRWNQTSSSKWEEHIVRRRGKILWITLSMEINKESSFSGQCLLYQLKHSTFTNLKGYRNIIPSVLLCLVFGGGPNTWTNQRVGQPYLYSMNKQSVTSSMLFSDHPLRSSLPTRIQKPQYSGRKYIHRPHACACTSEKGTTSSTCILGSVESRCTVP